MRKLQHLMVSMLCFSPFLSASAITGTMVATTADGNKVAVELENQMQAGMWTLREADSPLIFYVFTGAMAVDETGRPVPAEPQEGQLPGKIWFEMPVAELAGLEFTGLASVEAVSAGKGVAVNVTDGTVSVSGVESPVEINVYSLSGMPEGRMTITQDAVVDLNRYGSGMHLVKVGSATFKIMMK